MHPPFTAISKECTEEIELDYLKGKTVKIEKGINVYIPLHQFQYDPEFYPKPNEFNPERFSPENGGEKAFRDKGVFYAFGNFYDFNYLTVKYHFITENFR
jgi:cytochrome P450 family 28